MNALTLTYGGTTKTLADWGYNQPTMKLRSRAASTFTLNVAGGDPAAAAPIPYGGLVVIKDAGTTIFVGTRTDLNGRANPKSRGMQMTFSDPLFDLSITVYQNKWYVGGEPFYSPRVWLFMNNGAAPAPWGYWSCAEQIVDIINFAHDSCGIAIQPGTIDPPIIMPVYPVVSQTCLQCINILIQSLPDVVTYFDYTAVDGDGNPLPKLHIRIRQNLAAVTLPYANGPTPGGQTHVSTDIKPREDLQIAQVVINYQQSNVIEGEAFTTFETDVYPPGSNGLAPGSLVQQFDLRGASQRSVTGTVTADAVDPTTTDFWEDMNPALDDDAITGLTIVGTPTIKDASTGDDVALATYPNRVTGGQVCPWMKLSGGTGATVVGVNVVVAGVVSYTKNTADGFRIESKVVNLPVSCKLKLTNSPPGQVNYKAVAEATAAEVPPVNMAYMFWCSVNNVPLNYVDDIITPPGDVPALTDPEYFQWEGEHTIIEETISTYYTPGNMLNLDDSDGGNAAWAAMKATIVEVHYDFFNGKTTLNFGPHKSMTITEFFGQLMMSRVRIAWDNPNVPSSGKDSSAQGTQLGDHTPTQDTVHAPTPTKSITSVTGPVVDAAYPQSSHDCTNASGYPHWDAGVYDSDDGTPIDGEPLIRAHLEDVTVDVDVVLQWRKITYLNASCATVHRWVLCSDEIAGA